jgi:hypothetical protein
MAAYDRSGYARRRPGHYDDEEASYEAPPNQTQPVVDDPIAPPAAIADPPPAAAAAPPRQLSGGHGIANQGSFAGFDFNRGQDRSSSAKDSFAYYGGAGANDQRWRTKDGADDWFNEFIRPGLEAEGYQVGDVQGDKAFVHTRENPEGTWIDFVQGADGDNPMLAWQDESYMGDGGPGDQAMAAQGQAAGNLAGMPGGSDLLAALMADDGLQGSDLMAQIQAELQKLLTGQAPSDPNVPLPQGAQ